MKSRGMAPAALLLNYGNPIMAQGAAFAELAFMDRFEQAYAEIGLPKAIDRDARRSG